tara:strand:+ start:1075 stop:2355 length:1281 start_codon:yes stop_codon:yes gene_type:complete
MSLSKGLSFNRTSKSSKYKIRKSPHLDATDAYFIANDNAIFDHDDSSKSIFTISLWFKADVGSGTLGDARTLVAKNTGSNKEFVLYAATDRTLNLTVTGDGTTDKNNALGYTISDTNWHHIAVGYKGDETSEVTCWVDGVEKTVTQHAGNPSSVHTGSGPFYIGTIDGTNDLWDGHINEVVYLNLYSAASEFAKEATKNNLKPFRPERALRKIGAGDLTGNAVWWTLGDGQYHPPGANAGVTSAFPNLFAGKLFQKETDLVRRNVNGLTSGTYGWTAYGNNTIENDDYALKITYVDNSNGAYLELKNNANNLTSNLTISGFYVFECMIKGNSGVSSYVRILHNAGGSTYAHEGKEDSSIIISNTEYKKVRCIFRASHADDDRIALNVMSSGEIIWIKNPSIYPLSTTSNPLLGSGMIDSDFDSETP